MNYTIRQVFTPAEREMCSQWAPKLKFYVTELTLAVDDRESCKSFLFYAPTLSLAGLLKRDKHINIQRGGNRTLTELHSFHAKPVACYERIGLYSRILACTRACVWVLTYMDWDDSAGGWLSNLIMYRAASRWGVA